MRFCKYCGTQIESEMVCNCPEAQAERRSTPPPPPLRTAVPPPPPSAKQVQQINIAHLPPTSTPQYIAPPKPPVLGCVRCNIQAPKGGGQFCNQCGGAYQMMEPPKPVFNMCPSCYSMASKGGGLFCNQCGGQYQMMEAPSFEKGGVCPHCKIPVPPGSGQYCTHCGSVFFGSSISRPANMSLQGADNFVGNLMVKTGLSFQRLVLIATSAFGILFALLPWHHTESWALAMTNVGMFSTLCSGVAIVFLAGAAAVCFSGDRAAPLGKIKYAATAGGAVSLLAALFFMLIFNMTDVATLGVGRVGFCLYVFILCAIGVSVIPFVKKLER